MAENKFPPCLQGKKLFRAYLERVYSYKKARDGFSLCVFNAEKVICKPFSHAVGVRHIYLRFSAESLVSNNEAFFFLPFSRKAEVIPSYPDGECQTKTAFPYKYYTKKDDN